MTSIVVGPMLRFVDQTRATVWIEVSDPCRATLQVDGRQVSENTWGLYGHHFALLHVEGLTPGTENDYQILLDGQQVWPQESIAGPDSRGPDAEEPTAESARGGAAIESRPSVIRTPVDGDTVRLSFGSCRRGESQSPQALREIGADALDALALRMADTPRAEWPDALLLLGDQVYADIPSKDISDRLAERRARGGGPASVRASKGAGGDRDVYAEICDFEEYSWLYRESWRDPEVRWLLSTVPSCMILDDHDLRDDWNSSYLWRREMSSQPWWPDRVVGALSSYFVYQHLGNLSPEELAENAMYQALRSAPSDAERERVLAEFALRADSETTSAQWSYHRDFGRVRVVMLDVRASRRLEPEHRRVMDTREWAWTEKMCLSGDVDHLVIGSSLPVFMIPALHNIEGWNEAVSQRGGGKPLSARAGEWVRRAVDLEHWAAFRQSFDDMVGLMTAVATGRGDNVPASILVLGGDVHCSYLEEVSLPGADGADAPRVHQLVMSPFRNPLHQAIRVVNRLALRRPVVWLTERLARAVGVSDPGARWQVSDGVWFSNGVMTLVLSGRSARVEVDHAHVEWSGRGADRQSQQVLRRTMEKKLS